MENAADLVVSYGGSLSGEHGDGQSRGELLPRMWRRVVVLEPSCAAVFRSDAAELLGSDDASLLARQTTTLAELLGEAGWRGRPRRSPSCSARPAGAPARRWRRGRAQGHRAGPLSPASHHGLRRRPRAAQRLRRGTRRAGRRVLRAGNFGFERGHYDVSVACAEQGLWPAVRDTDPGTAVLADGFSCRTQIEAGHLGRVGIHLAQLLTGMPVRIAAARWGLIRPVADSAGR